MAVYMRIVTSDGRNRFPFFVVTEPVMVVYEIIQIGRLILSQSVYLFKNFSDSSLNCLLNLSDGLRERALSKHSIASLYFPRALRACPLSHHP
jgi:hypothetical protein